MKLTNIFKILINSGIIFIASSVFFLNCEANSSNSHSNSSSPKNHSSIESNLILSNISNISLPNELDFCGEKVPMNDPEIRERVEREFYLLLQQQGQLVLYLKRAGRYFPTYERFLQGLNLPDDLKYLSVAESALFQSRSSKNAYGLWQFMEGTARTYGLRVDKYVDERLHIEKSTVAALTYLSASKKSLGTWTLAAAAYNMGNAGVRRAMEKQNVNNYFDLYLNEETSRFIFRIVIIKELMKNSNRYGLDVAPEATYMLKNIKTIQVDGAIPDLYEWASKNKNLYKDVKLLNPWILTDQLPAGKWEITIYDKGNSKN